MCGIIGYIGKSNAVPVLVNGLEHLEYRGYDSAGIACFDLERQDLFVMKEKGKLAALKEHLKDISLTAKTGIGHTRWATHGEPSRANAHPHVDSGGRLALIHNGILENYAAIKKNLLQKGYRFQSQTDTEVAVNLIASFYKTNGLVQAFRKAVKRMNGFFAFVLLSKEEPDKLIVFKRSNPLIIGLGEGENFVASDVSALLSYTRKVLYLEDDEYAVITREKVEIFSLATGKPVKRKPVEVHWDVLQAQKGGYAHFMLKEIYEQPQVIKESIVKRINRKDEIVFDTLSLRHQRRLQKIKRVFLVSCGTAHHAGIIGATMLEELARVLCKSQVSSEFRYADPIVGKDDLVILITQSGETADTLAALREAKSKGAMTVAVVNVVGSTIAREADAVLYTHAGPEIGVASTKAYLAQILTLSLFTLYLARLRRQIKIPRFLEILREIKQLPNFCRKVLSSAEAVEKCAAKHYNRRNFLYLGRGYNVATALEGALKLKEISYAHAHGYAAGEMKHGPIALIDEQQLVICIAPKSRTYEKIISNIEEIRARSGIVIVIGTQGDKRLQALAETFFPVPPLSEFLSPLLTVIPLQLFAYKIAVLNGRDVDQPRNLAKSVTVE